MPRKETEIIPKLYAVFTAMGGRLFFFFTSFFGIKRSPNFLLHGCFAAEIQATHESVTRNFEADLLQGQGHAEVIEPRGLQPYVTHVYNWDATVFLEIFKQN